MADFKAVGAVHGEIFGDIRPATAVVEVKAPAADDLLVEIEADASVATLSLRGRFETMLRHLSLRTFQVRRKGCPRLALNRAR